MFFVFHQQKWRSFLLSIKMMGGGCWMSVPMPSTGRPDNALLVFLCPVGSVLFPVWEWSVPSVGIRRSQHGNDHEAWEARWPNPAVLPAASFLQRCFCEFWAKVPHLSHQCFGSPVYKGVSLFSSLPSSLTSSLTYLSHFFYIRTNYVACFCVELPKSVPNRYQFVAECGGDGRDMWEICERLETSLTCSNPFVQRRFERISERWQFAIAQSW